MWSYFNVANNEQRQTLVQVVKATLSESKHQQPDTAINIILHPTLLAKLLIAIDHKNKYLQNRLVTDLQSHSLIHIDDESPVPC